MATDLAKKLRPLDDRLVVEVVEEANVTASGIVLPDSAKEKPQKGKVVAVGPGKFEQGQLIPMHVKVGDMILFTKYGPTEVKVDGQELTFLQQSDVLAVLS